MCDSLKTLKLISCQELENTKTLPVKISPKALSNRLLEYSNSKEKQHEECFKKMRMKLETINSDFDKEIKELTELLKCDIDMLDDEMQACVTGPITRIDQLIAAQSTFSKLENRVESIIKEFHLDLKDIERRRCENIKTVLQTHKEEAVKIRCVNIESVEDIFKNIIDDINHTTLDNLERCEDIKLQYQIVVEDLVLKCKEVLDLKGKKVTDEIYFERLKNEKTEPIRMLVEDSINRLHEIGSNAVNNLEKGSIAFIEKLSDLVSIIDISEFQQNYGGFLTQLNKYIELQFESVSNYSTDLNDIIMSAIEIITQTFENAKTSLFSLTEGDLDHDEALLIFSKLENKNIEELGAMQLLQNVLEELQNKLEGSKMFFLGVVSFWLNNLARCDGVRQDVKSKLDSNYQKCLKKYQEFNLKEKPKIKALREAPDLGKLESCAQLLEADLADMFTMWNEAFDLNTNVLQGVKTENVAQLVDQTITDSNALLQMCPSRSWHSVNHDDSFSTKYSFIMKLCNCVDDLVNETCILSKNMETYYGEYEIERQYDDLLEEATRANDQEREKAFTELIQKSQQLATIKKIRRAELEIHSERLTSHQTGVNLIIKNLITKYEEAKSFQNTKLIDFNDSLPKTDEIQKLVNGNQIKSLINKLEQDWNSLSIIIFNSTIDAKMNSQHTFETLKHSNDSFLRIAKPFKGGGNYSANEIKLLTKELKQLEKSFSGQEKSLSNQYNALMKNVLRKELDFIIKLLNDKLVVANLNDKIENTLYYTRMKLRAEINDNKSSQDMLSSKIKHFLSMDPLNEGLFDEIRVLALSTLDEMYFEQPLECELKLGSFMQPNIEQALKTGPKTTKQDNPPNTQSYKCLFQSINTEDFKSQTNFLSRVKCVLADRFVILIQNIEDTLCPKTVAATKSKKKEIITDSKSKDVMRNIEYIRIILLAYNEECETIWFHQSKEFINELITFENCIKDLAQTFLERAHEFHLSNLRKMDSYYNSKALITCKGTFEINKLKKSIRLPLAHPNYQHKLKELNKTAKSIYMSTINEYKGLVHEYQDCLQKEHDNYVAKITELKDTFECIHHAIIEMLSHNKLVSRVQEVENSILNQTVGVEDKSLDLLSAQQTNIAVECVEEQVKDVETDPKQDESIKYPMSIWEDDESPFPQLSSISQHTQWLPSEENCILAMATTNLKGSVETVLNFHNKFESEAKIFEKEMTSCMNSIKNDLKQATNMYNSICQ